MVQCLLCKRDCTYAYHQSAPQKPFKCKCGSAEFIETSDMPKVPWKLNVNDKKLLRRHDNKVRYGREYDDQD